MTHLLQILLCGNYSYSVMTIHVLHAGDGYLYLIRSVAAHDGRLGLGETLAAYYTASGQPPGVWSGRGASRLGVSGVVTEDQMRALFGKGLHPNADAIRASLVAGGTCDSDALQDVRLGRRFPQYGRPQDLKALARGAYERVEADLGRPMTVDEKLEARQRAAALRFETARDRSALDPHELATLGRQTSSREAVAGYDFVFTPVKSVAVLWGLASDETRQQIFEAHVAAVADALIWLESNIALTRTGTRGQAQINTLGVTAAMFHHWDSRAGDPDLHTHVAISNKVHGPDEKWRSLDGRPLFAAAVSLSERYNTQIEDGLRERLDVEFTERAGSEDGRRPVREIAGIPEALIELFSKRRQGIEQQYRELLNDYRQNHGRDPHDGVRSQLYQQATLTNRPEKVHGRSLQEMIDAWRDEASLALGLSDIESQIERQTLDRTSTPRGPDIDELADGALKSLMASRSTWNLHHLRAEAQRQSRPFVTKDRDLIVEEIVAVATRPDRSIRIETPRTLAEPVELQRADGESVFVEYGSTLFTTDTILSAEEQIVRAAKRDGCSRVQSRTVDDVLLRAESAERPLNADQRRMVNAFCTSGRLVQLGLAPAGAGKTTAMRAVAEAWTLSGRPITALAPSAVAADILGEELGADADTLAKFDYDEPKIAPETMILIDEAGMAGTLVLDRIVERAARAGAVVRLLGDVQQLAAIEAGGVLRQLDHEVGSVRLSQVVRFADPAEASATLQVRDGVTSAVDFYLANGRIIAGTDLTIPEAAYAAWLTDVREGRDSILLAAGAKTVSDLNARARADLVIGGQVATDGIALRDGNVAAVGDQVCTRRNSRRLMVSSGRDWVKNGDGWRVLAVHDDGALTVQHRVHRGRVTLPEDYARAYVELDYARTIRRAQGMTVDRAHLIVDPQLSREDLYVGLSRARQGTQLYVATMTDERPDHLPDAAGAACDILASIIERTGTEPSAREAIREALAGAVDLRRMAVEYEHALGVHVSDRYRLAAEALHPGISADPAWPSVAHRLHLAEGAGLSVDGALRRAESMRSYTDARSDTQVLVFRLDRVLAEAGRGGDDPGQAVPVWLAAAPPTQMPTPWNTYLPARYDEMADRISSLVVEATAESAPWLREIGEISGRNGALRQVVAYRAVYGIRSDNPVGPEPAARTRQHQAWSAATNAIHASNASPSSGAARLGQLLLAADTTRPDDPLERRRHGPTRTA